MSGEGGGKRRWWRDSHVFLQPQQRGHCVWFILLLLGNEGRGKGRSNTNRVCSSAKSFSCFLSEMRSLSSPGLVADSVDVVALALDSFLATELLSVELAGSPFLCVVTVGGEMGKRERLSGEGGGVLYTDATSVTWRQYG